MERTQVKSSFLAAIGYNAESQTLEVEFTNGRIYQYFGVTPEIHKALITAESIGKYYNRNGFDKLDHRRAKELEAKEPAPADQ